MKFLFWNINKKPLGGVIASIIHEQDIDVLILAECDKPNKIIDEINKINFPQYNYHVNPVKRIEVFSRLPEQSIESIGDYSGLSFRRLVPPVGFEILLVGAHLPSKLHMSDADQMFECTRLISQVQEYENRLSHRRTVVVGDLNMNPFEFGLIAAQSFHASLSRHIAKRESREIKGANYYFFYNPMWNHFGDRGPSPPGTYYYDNSAPTSYFWNMFDQILIRPDLLTYFRDDSVEIITSVEGKNLLRPNGRPDTSWSSDHLPILFSLNLMETANVS